MIRYFSGLFVKISEKLNEETVLYIFLGMLAVIFVLLCFTSGGEFSRIKRKESKLLKTVRGSKDRADAVKAEIGKMPDRIKKAYEKAEELNVFPATVMTVEYCVLTPFSACLLKSLCTVTLTVTAVLDALLLSYGNAVWDTKSTNAAFAVLTLAGVVLAVVGEIIVRLSIKNAIKTHEKLMELLDEKAGVLSETALPVIGGEGEFSPASVIDFDTVTAPETQEELEEDEHKMVMTDLPAEESNEKTVEVIQPTVEFEPKAEEPEKIEDEEDNEEEYDEPAVPFGMHDKPVEPEYEDVITRVERIGRTGATADEMKEVLALLNAERLKPENRTPEGKRRLDEAFASLLRSVNRATKTRRR